MSKNSPSYFPPSSIKSSGTLYRISSVSIRTSLFGLSSNTFSSSFRLSSALLIYYTIGRLLWLLHSYPYTGDRTFLRCVGDGRIPRFPYNLLDVGNETREFLRIPGALGFIKQEPLGLSPGISGKPSPPADPPAANLHHRVHQRKATFSLRAPVRSGRPFPLCK